MGYAISRDEIIAVLDAAFDSQQQIPEVADLLITKISERDACYGKAMLQGAPIFVLKATDPLAAGCVRVWAREAALTFSPQGVARFPQSVIREAEQQADRIERWHAEHRRERE